MGTNRSTKNSQFPYKNLFSKQVFSITLIVDKGCSIIRCRDVPYRYGLSFSLATLNFIHLKVPFSFYCMATVSWSFSKIFFSTSLWVISFMAKTVRWMEKFVTKYPQHNPNTICKHINLKFYFVNIQISAELLRSQSDTHSRKKIIQNENTNEFFFLHILSIKCVYVK